MKTISGRLYRLAPFAAVLVLLAGCGAQSFSAAQVQGTVEAVRTQNPVIHTQVVTQVVTATPLPATPTPRATPTPTPEPEVKAKIKTETGLWNVPDVTYTEKQKLAAGQEVVLNFKATAPGDKVDWIAVNLGDEYGWVQIEAIDIPADVLEQLPEMSGPFLVVTGDIVLEDLAGTTVFKGTVRNFGGATAEFAEVEIETFDENGNRIDLVNGVVPNLNIEPGSTERFSGISQASFDNYSARATCSNCTR